jgi:aarF domain-containing kinase
LYFDYPEDLRIAYANLWLSLISPSSPAVEFARRKYAYLAGNIDESLYPLFQAAITGRVALASGTGDGEENGGSRAGSMMELGVLTKEESHKLRSAMVQEGLMLQIFDLLRRVPRRMLMVLKVK